MSQEAIPIIRAEFEVKKEHPELQGVELNDAIRKKIEEIKERSVSEKKQGSLRYRGNMFWAGITSQEDFDEKCREAVTDYRSGNFFMERIGRYREVDVPLTMVALDLREQWIQEYDIKTAPELMLLDMALVSYFHFLRLNEAINNIMAGIEWEMFALEAPRSNDNSFWRGLTGTRKDKKVAEELAHRLQEILQPVLDQYNRMFIRNLKALRDLKRGNIQLNIGNVGQVNIGDKQVNVEKHA